MHLDLVSDILDRNNNYSDTLDFRRGEVVMFFLLEAPGYKFIMSIDLIIFNRYIFIYV